MGRSNPSPSYRRQKAKPNDRAFVQLNGRRFYLGLYNTLESWERYHQLVGEYLSTGGYEPVASGDLLIVELLARFIEHAKQYYRRPDGSMTNEALNYQQATKPLQDLYGRTRVTKFGPKALRAVRQRMIQELGWCRSNVNNQVARIKHVFKWAVSEELVVPSVYQALQAVEGLKRGRSEARESEPVRPVPETDVLATEPYVSAQVWALIQLQLLTAARAGELVILRPIDIDTTGDIWLYSPITHKTAYHGNKRTIYLGPRAQDVVGPFLTGRPVDAFVFSPAEAEEARRARMHAERKVPLSCGNVPGSNRLTKPTVIAGDRYTVDSYRRAISRGCAAAGVPAWSPHRLRHSAATNIRKDFGLEAAQLMLGHARADVTQIYAETNRSHAFAVASAIG